MSSNTDGEYELSMESHQIRGIGCFFDQRVHLIRNTHLALFIDSQIATELLIDRLHAPVRKGAQVERPGNGGFAP
jgi:hypothetical protein